MTDREHTIEDRPEFTAADEVGRLVYAAMKHRITRPDLSLYLADAAVTEAHGEVDRLKDEAESGCALVEAHQNVAFAQYVRQRLERTIRARLPHLDALRQTVRRDHVLGVTAGAVTYH